MLAPDETVALAAPNRLDGLATGVDPAALDLLAVAGGRGSDGPVRPAGADTACVRGISSTRPRSPVAGESPSRCHGSPGPCAVPLAA